ncbi:MAG: serine protease [Clostridiaceae bacterium]|nr:serine protease [Clostridiaceae bacterium]MBW4860811.1 serine protease [Clostridiaceae bacterium]MBW4867436.1 serine protease [Clostridiaceae bacterium]
MKKSVKKSLLSLTIAAFLISPINLASAANSTTKNDCSTPRYNCKTNVNWKNCFTRYTWSYNYKENSKQHNNTKQDQVSDEKNNTNKPEENITNEKENNTKPSENVAEKNTSTENNTQKEVNQDITTSANAEELKVVELVNVERNKAGLSPLTYNEELSKVARIKSQDMADKNYFSHNSPTYKDPFTMMKNFGIKYGQAGENIAKGYSNADSVVKGWMNSPGHRANILNSNFKKIGVGYVNKGGTTYWTQMFTD